MLRNSLCFFFVVILLVTVASAVPPTPLPSVALQALDGSRIQSERLAREGRWLLILVRGNSGGGDALLDFVSSLQPAMNPARMAIVVSGGDLKVLEAMKSKRPPVEGAAWYLDERDALAQGFGVKATPIVLGIQQGTAMWSVSGLPDSFQMDPILRSWLGE